MNQTTPTQEIIQEILLIEQDVKYAEYRLPFLIDSLKDRTLSIKERDLIKHLVKKYS